MAFLAAATFAVGTASAIATYQGQTQAAAKGTRPRPQPPGQPLRHVIFGLRGDVAAAQYLFELVERAFGTETAAFRAGPIYAAMAGDRRSASNSFQIGLGRGICDKLRALRAARSAAMQGSGGRDLVPRKESLVEAEMEKLGLSLRFRSQSRKRVLSEAYAAGTEAGERFEYTPGIGTGG